MTIDRGENKELGRIASEGVGASADLARNLKEIAAALLATPRRRLAYVSICLPVYLVCLTASSSEDLNNY